MLFSELIASEDYKPRPNARSTDKDKVIQRLALNAHRAFEDAVAEGKVDLLPERSYIMASELVDAAGGKFDGRDRRLEDFNLDEGSRKTQAFIKEFFKGTRSYGKRKTKPAGQKSYSPEYQTLKESIAYMQDAQKGTKSELILAVDSFVDALTAYAEKFPALRGLVPAWSMEDIVGVTGEEDPVN